MDLAGPQLTAKPVSPSHRESGARGSICMRLHRGGHGRLGHFKEAFAFIEAISGQGIVNYKASANSFYYLGLPTDTSEVYDFVGSSVTRSLTLNGHYNFHYDEPREKSGPMRVLV